MMQCPGGFIKEFIELLQERYKDRINIDYAFALSEVLLSSACWNIHFDNGYGTNQPNIWIQVVLPSGDIKSNPITKLVLPIIRKLEECLNEGCVKEDDIHDKLLISSYTQESIIKFMNVHKETTYNGDTNTIEEQLQKGNLGLIWVDESSILTRGAKTKDYMSGLLEVDSLIYDGGVPERYTMTHGLHQVPFCYKAKISATTPVIYGIMEQTDVIQGGWNRFDVVVGIPIDPEFLKEHDPDTFFRRMSTAQWDDLYEHFSNQLIKVIWSKTDRVHFDEEATKIWVKYELKNKMEALRMAEKDLRRGYKNRMAEKVLKRAVLYTISKFIDLIDEAKVGSIIVTAEEMNMAIHNQEEYYGHWNRMLTEWKLSPKSGESTLFTDEAKRERLKAVLQLMPQVSRQRVIEETGWNDGSNYFKDTLGSFVSENKIKTYAMQDARALIEEHKSEKGWIDFQKVKLPVRGKVPVFYEWIGET